MPSLKDLVSSYIVHQYHTRMVKSKEVEVALYSLDANDIKYRLVKFVDQALKEVRTFEDKEEALAAFELMGK